MKQIVYIFLSIIVILSSCKEVPANSSKLESKKVVYQNPKTKLLKVASHLLKAKKYKKLIAYLSQIPKEKQSYETHSFMGQGYLKQKKYSKALPYFKESVRLSESMTGLDFKIKAKLHSFLAYTYEKLKKLDSARDGYLKASTYASKNPIVWTNLARIYLIKKDYLKAEQTFLKAYRINPEYHNALAGLGKSYLYLKQYSKAITFYKKLVQLLPNSSLAYIGMGKAFLKANNKTQGHEMLAKGYYLSRQYSKAIVQLNKFPTLRQNKEWIKLLIACHLGAKSFGDAEKEIQKAIAQFPTDDEFTFDRTQIYFYQKDYNKSLKLALNGLKKFPKSYLLHVVVANSYNALNQKKKAGVYYEKVLEINEDDVMAREKLAQIYRLDNQKDKEYYHQGIVYFKTGEYDQAEHVLSWIQKDFPDKGKLSYYKGMISWALKKKDEGLKQFQEAIKEDQKYHMPYISLARAFNELNQPKKGINVLKDFMGKFPESPHFNEVKNEYSKMLTDLSIKK
ncbi:MAG: hypothetical protein IEMM0008_1346 [bacterium]|nr:MAG: hypothetical protein IEMM0008_1346 [bacterium]